MSPRNRTASRSPAPGTLRRGIETRRRLIDAAIDCLSRSGYGRVPTLHIAKQAGVSRGPLQYYFPKKIDLMLAVFDEFHERRAERNADAMPGGDTGRARIEQIIDASFAGAGSPKHLAELELKLAMKSDIERRAAAARAGSRASL